MSSSSSAPHGQHLTPGTPPATRSAGSAASSPAQSSPRPNVPRINPSGLLDLATVLRQADGDAARALETVLNDRNSLSAQNTQLWKLIEKQRSQCAHLAADNDRLRADREKANVRLVASGMEPIGGKKMPNSASVQGLTAGLKQDAPPMRRNNSDRLDRTESKPSIDAPRIKTDSNPPTPTTEQHPPEQRQPASSTTPKAPSAPTLLPSPMAEASKPPRDSRMAFPPEVSSYMTLAESPRETTHFIPNLSIPSANSPASGVMSSPNLSARSADGHIPPPSSRPLRDLTEEVEPGEQLRRPARLETESGPSVAPSRSPLDSPSAASFPGAPPRPVRMDSKSSHLAESDDDHAALRPSTDAYRAPARSSSLSIPQMTAQLLPYTRITIPQTTVFPNTSGRDVLCFVVVISVRTPNVQPMTWSVAKLFSAFVDLDTRIKAKSGKGRKDWKSMVAPLPEVKAWRDYAPSKIDQRKVALETYLQSLLAAPLSDKTDLCEFLSTDPVQEKQDTARKEGYLTKKGKNFGGWRTRYFVLEGPVMEYFESRGGQHLGSIVITHAQIGRQNRPADSSDDKNFRHAFLIIEAPRKGASSTRHVLCAESDAERDSWIDMLVRFVDPEPAEPEPPLQPQQRKRSDSKKSGKDVVITASQPMTNLMSDPKFAGAPSPSYINSIEQTRQQGSTPPSASRGPPMSPVARSAGSSMPPPSNPPDPGRIPPMPQSPGLGKSKAEVMPPPPPPPPVVSQPTGRAAKRQSMMPGRSQPPPAPSAAYLTKLSQEGVSSMPGYPEKDRDRKAKSGRFWPSFGKQSSAPEKAARPVFAVPLLDSIAVANVGGLPAIVYRCIEWLEAKHAEREEGIYRLSGSSAVIKGLKERFDQEGDVNLLGSNGHFDPHAIAGLLKNFLRDLPTSLLTSDLHASFLAVMDLIDASARVAELSRLVSEMPPPNYALLRALTAHLILIVRHSTENKMTLRNIGIVFSPTLGIPAGIFSDLVSHFGAIFDDEPFEDGIGGGATGVDPASVDGASAGGAEMSRKRNSLLYQAAGADAMLGLGGRSLDPAMEDDNSEASADAEADDLESEGVPVPTDEGIMTPTPPSGGLNAARVGSYPSTMGVAYVPQTPRANANTNADSGAERSDHATLTPNARTAQTVAE